MEVSALGLGCMGMTGFYGTADRNECKRIIQLNESLEQLRFLYYGMSISVHETIYKIMGIDLQEHLELAEMSIKTSPA